MPCYSPITAIKRYDTGKMDFSDSNDAKRNGREVKLPCNGCIGCRLDYSRHWGVRMYHELQMHDDALFLTLTYRDEDLPDDMNIHKKHVQDFNKRLRKFIYPTKIRSYTAGEYGEKLSRPHYHQILFGWAPGDMKPVNRSRGNIIYNSATLDDIWQKGFVHIGTNMEINSMMYTARYVMKKQKGKAAKENPKQHIIQETGELITTEPEFAIMSRKPGIARPWLEAYWQDVYPHDFVVVENRKFNPPAFYDKFLDEIEPDLLESVKQKRMIEAPQPTQDELDIRRIIKESQLSRLTRSLEL